MPVTLEGWSKVACVDFQVTEIYGLTTIAMSYKDALLSNMVAGNMGVGAGRFGGVLPKFDESDFDGWVLFMKAPLRKFDRTDLALSDPMPRKEVDDDGEEVDFSDSNDEELFPKKLTKWSTRNDQAYSLIMEACLNHPWWPRPIQSLMLHRC